jgi:nitroreductase
MLMAGLPRRFNHNQFTEMTSTLSSLIRSRRSTRDFLSTPIPEALLNTILEDANWAPSGSNVQPFRIAIASGEVRAKISADLCARFDRAMLAQKGGIIDKLRMVTTKGAMPDGDFKVNFAYPKEFMPRKQATGKGLYETLNIERNNKAARDKQLRRNFEFFGAPTAIFFFIHETFKEYAAIDAGIFMQTLMLSAHDQGLASCPQAALGTWGSPVRAVFDIPKAYKLISGLSIGYAAPSAVNQYNPGRGTVNELQFSLKP